MINQFVFVIQTCYLDTRQTWFAK